MIAKERRLSQSDCLSLSLYIIYVNTILEKISCSNVFVIIHANKLMISATRQQNLQSALGNIYSPALNSHYRKNELRDELRSVVYSITADNIIRDIHQREAL